MVSLRGVRTEVNYLYHRADLGMSIMEKFLEAAI
jgi:hypothetical protein